MKFAAKSVQKEFEKHWPSVKKNISDINKEVIKLAKESEKKLVHASKKLKKQTHQLFLKAKREELYYELGKVLASNLTSDQLKNKKVLEINNALKKTNRKLRSKK